MSRLTLIEPVFFAVAREDNPAIYAEHAARFVPFAKAIETGEDDKAAQIFTDMWGSGVPWRLLPDQARKYITERIHLIPAGVDAIEADRDGVVARLSEILCPVTLIEGAKSPPIVDVIQAGLLARFSTAQRHIVDGAGHMVPLTHPAEVARIIREAI